MTAKRRAPAKQAATKKPAAEMLLLRATEITGRPVVSIAEGEALANVKDVLYSPEDGRILGVTLNKRGGLFAGPMKVALALEQLHAIGRDAVTVASSEVLDEPEGEAARDEADRHRDVLGNEVLADSGTALGTVTDIVVQGGVIGAVTGSSAPGDVVGYQVTPSGEDKHEEFVPLPYTLAVSGSHLVVPASVTAYVTSDLSGFGGSVESFRAQLGAAPEKGARS